MRAFLRSTVFLAAVGLLLMSISAVASAQQAEDITLDSPVRSFELGPTEDRADLDVKLRNTTDSRLLVKLTLEGLPEGWDIGVWNRFFDYKIEEMVVEPTTEETPGPNLRMRIVLPLGDDRPTAGAYAFVLNVTSPDGRVQYDQATFTVVVPEEQQEEVGTEMPLRLRSSFPELGGEGGKSQEFEVVIRNETGEERVFQLRAGVLNERGDFQPNWLLFFKPSFGTERIISSISVPDNLTENIDVVVTPLRNTPAGDYTILVTVSSEAQEEGQAYEEAVELTLSISGQGEITATTASGLLSLDATAGGEADMVLRLWNLGSAPLTDINLSSDSPGQWKVTYAGGDSVDVLSDLSGENFADLPLTIEPPGDAVPGDYLVTLRASNRDSTDTVDIRVTVTQSTIWGWLGIVLVLGVLGGLVGLFVRLGRR